MLDRFEYGSGQLVVLCHGAASHSGQWRDLINLLKPNYRVIAFDQYAYRNSPSWTLDRPMLYIDQAQPILDFIQCELGTTLDKVHLVGHSHGASIAASLAISLGERVSSLSIYEPNSFGVLKHDQKRSYQYKEIITSFGNLTTRVSSLENQMGFAEDLMNFWLGEGAWKLIPVHQQQQLISVMPQTVNEVYAALYSPFEIVDLRQLGKRLLLMYDPFTPFFARAVSEHYLEILDQAEVKRFEGCGHLAPISNADLVNKAIINQISVN